LEYDVNARNFFHLFPNPPSSCLPAASMAPILLPGNLNTRLDPKLRIRRCCAAPR
jgi:hypothetical protein